MQKKKKIVAAHVPEKPFCEGKPVREAEFKTYFCQTSVQSQKSSAMCSLSQKYLKKQNPAPEQRWANRV